MLGPGDAVPSGTVWTTAIDAPVPVADAIRGEGHSIVCFYPFAFSPG